jgi:hypothetical protein
MAMRSLVWFLSAMGWGQAAGQAMKATASIPKTATPCFREVVTW